MKTKILTLVFSAISVLTANSQGLPDDMYFSPDGKILYTGGKPASGFYDQSVIRSINLDFSQANYWTLLQQGYTSRTDIMATMTVDGLLMDSVGVRFKGNTSYQGTGSSQKKSFNITTDSYLDGQDLMGYNIINLNNCYQDPSFLREYFYLNQIKKHIPVAKASFAKLYINGANWGIYPNVQQLNKDFYKEWFLNNNGTSWRADKPPGSPGGGGGGWGDGTAALNFLGTDTSLYKSHYTLKSTDKNQPWDDLVTICRVLDTTSASNMEAVISDYLDLDRALWFLGSEILFTDDDSYVYKGKMDYFVYWDEVTGRITPIEFDGNSSMELNFATSWSPFYRETNANYPLVNKLMAVPSIRQRYLAHMRTLIAEEMDSAAAIQALEYYASIIDTMVQNDPKKLYTYAQFTAEVEDLKDFIVTRRNYMLSNAEVNRVSPTISDVNYLSSAGTWLPPSANQAVTVTARATSSNSMFGMNLYYGTDVFGKFLKTTMYDDGAHNDSAAFDGIFGGTIPGQSSGQWVRFYIEAISADINRTVSYSPPGAEHNVYVYQVVPTIAANINVTINEVMASNTATAADSAGQYDDWIEIYNLTSQPQDISGYYLTDNSLNLTKFEFPSGTVIAPNDYLIVWADEDGGQGDLHANFKLSSSGEHLMLLNGNLEVVDDVTFGTQVTDMGYARVPNGTGSFVIQTPTFSANNDLNTSVEVLKSNTGISVYPNPASDYIKIYLSSAAGDDIEIYNSLGDLILKEKFKNSVEVNTASWSNGIYVIRSGNSSRKVLIQQ
jgi:hypothetical protein